MVNKEKLLDAVLDNQTVSDDVLIAAVEKVIAEGKPFNHGAESSHKACNVLDLKTKDLSGISDKISSTSEAVEALEKVFTKRELAYMLAISKEKVDMVRQALIMINKLTEALR